MDTATRTERALTELGLVASKIMQDYDLSARKISTLELELQKALAHIRLLERLSAIEIELD
jgi:hypothetical protein|tara:strand:- start:481 stop:663 length:183 start_codon:yes stop_codon:yes gene_type:complete